MYRDQDSIKVFERVHARDRARGMARHIGDPSPDDIDVFGAHLQAANRDNLIMYALVIEFVTVLFAVFWI